MIRNKLWEAYQNITASLTQSSFHPSFNKPTILCRISPKETHRCVGKKSGETAHVERWNNTLGQRISRFARKTLSFSKKEVWHHMVTKLFVYNYNIAVEAKY